MDRKKRIKLLGLNLGVAVANVIIFSPGLIGLELAGAGALATALGSTIIFVSGTVLIYGNYKLLTAPERVIATNEIRTVDDFIEALNAHREIKTFEKTVDLLLDQIERHRKKNNTSRDILLQNFSDTEMSYAKFDAAIRGLEEIFFLNIRSIINKLNAFDEEDYNTIRKKQEAGEYSQQFMEDKLKIYSEYITFVKAAIEYNEKILLKQDRLLLEISGIDSVDSGQLEQMDGVKEIDDLIEQAKYYKRYKK